MTKKSFLSARRKAFRPRADVHPYYHRLFRAAETSNFGVYLQECEKIIAELNAAKVPGIMSVLFGQWMNTVGHYYFGESRIVEDAATGDNWISEETESSLGAHISIDVDCDYLNDSDSSLDSAA